VRSAVPPTFWSVVHRIAGGDTWPPANPTDAHKLIDRVIAEGLFSLLMADESLPPQVSRAMESHRAIDRMNRVRSQFLEDTLRSIVGVVEGEIIILKGSDYAYRLYPAPHLRARQDIDILVKRDRAADVTARLKKAGYQQFFAGGPPSRVSGYHEAVFEVGSTAVDVHHSFIQRTRNRVDYGAIWTRAKQWEACDARLLRLDDVDGLLYHAINMCNDHFQNALFRHLDLWLMLRDRPEILLPASERAKEWAIARPFYGALRQAVRLIPELQTPVMEKTLAGLLPRSTQEFLDKHVLPDPFRMRRHYGRGGTTWRKFVLIDDTRHRLAFAFYQPYAVIAGRLLELRDRRAARVSPQATSAAAD
jgi:hypothetical protein